jgi:hypothetical protein
MVQGAAGGLDGPVDVRIGAQRSGAEGLLGGSLQRAVRVQFLDGYQAVIRSCRIRA